MNRALLRELQEQIGYPSVTLLLTTTPGSELRPDDVGALVQLAAVADRRMTGDVPDDVRSDVMARIAEQIDVAAAGPATRAIAVCVSPQYQAVVRLGREVRDRCVVDDTFATRDMVADANRTLMFRVVTASDRMARLFVGDRTRLVEERNGQWPMVRYEDQTLSQWTRALMHAVRAEQQQVSVPTVVAGVERSIRELLKLDQIEPIAVLHGNHDRTGWAELHDLVWPLVDEWLRADRAQALRRLDDARSAHRYAGGAQEVWELARDGRVQLLVVEEDYAFAARHVDGALVPAGDPTAPDVIDDVIDELIETVLRKGGEAVIVPSGDLVDRDRLAAVLRY